ncbi:hypothetical protein COCC4DRAFT_64428 [Bipolaris maydis ATCC 48331]|uniref:DOC domain-containing protein n=1 Tax=Cochliobolus heterostrophus (strain C4 / ATCC 48331 / race T) TaxID=665024 RepID=N4X8X0_COCH4|nr:uncharacterized protein COCC4DRAFT_64428 [Bipolaris maydis ATCC 48331]ENI01637.1 hypothetical protein COCC4DRAFT_64428 [Bipolaris maydis ATCC 48331]
MPPSRRHRGQPHHSTPPSEADDTDNDMDLGARQEHTTDDEGEAEADDPVGLDDEDHAGHEEDENENEDEEDEELEDEALASPSQTTPLPNLDPPPPYLREISTLASWTVSSSKPGCSIPQLRHANTNLFWQSDGPQPHYLNIHFFKLVRIVGLRLYLDFEQDESYTPTRIIFLAGSGMNDLQEWGEMRLESPRGWIWADFSGVGDVDSDDQGDDQGDDDNDDNEDQANPPPTTTNVQRHHLLTDTTTPVPTQTPHQDLSSDSENAVPFPPPHLHTPLPTSSFDQPNIYTSTPSLHPTSTPSLHYPRAPFTSFTPSHPSSSFPRRIPPSRSPRAPKMPTLRCHLLQVKILENHQNGKDTHLRGLQVFARNDDDNAGAVGGRGVGEKKAHNGAVVATTTTRERGDKSGNDIQAV